LLRGTKYSFSWINIENNVFIAYIIYFVQYHTIFFSTVFFFFYQ